MASLTVENYVKTIYQLAEDEHSAAVATGQIASALGVLPGTVTSMLKTLSESGLADYRPYEGARLTRSGTTLALRMLRRHRLIELFLVKTLGLAWDEVHEEAENMEHAVSDVLIDRIDEFLGHPETDPHGDPIPTADGEMRTDTTEAVSLSQCLPGTKVRIVRVTNQGPDFLRFLSEAGLEIGILGVVTANNRESGLVTTKFDHGPVSMAHTAADALMVIADD